MNNFINNPLGIKKGDIVILDKGTSIELEVTVEYVTSFSGMYSIVSDDLGDSWEVMTNRLTKKEE